MDERRQVVGVSTLGRRMRQRLRPGEVGHPVEVPSLVLPAWRRCSGSGVDGGSEELPRRQAFLFGSSGDHDAKVSGTGVGVLGKTLENVVASTSKDQVRSTVHTFAVKCGPITGEGVVHRTLVAPMSAQAGYIIGDADGD